MRTNMTQENKNLRTAIANLKQENKNLRTAIANLKQSYHKYKNLYITLQSSLVAENSYNVKHGNRAEIDKVKKIVGAYFGVNLYDKECFAIRDRTHVIARNVSMWYFNKRMLISLKKSAGEFLKDHATCCHAITEIDKSLDNVGTKFQSPLDTNIEECIKILDNELKEKNC